MKPNDYREYHRVLGKEEQRRHNEVVRILDEYENSPEYKEEEQRRLEGEKEFYLECAEVIIEIKKNRYNTNYRKQIDELLEKFYKTQGWPERWIKPHSNKFHTDLTHQDICFKYKEMREKGYLKKSEAIAILCKKYGYKKNTIERIIYTGKSY